MGVLGRSENTAKGYIGMGKLAAKRLDKHVLKVDSEDLMAIMVETPWAPSTIGARIDQETFNREAEACKAAE